MEFRRKRNSVRGKTPNNIGFWLQKLNMLHFIPHSACIHQNNWFYTVEIAFCVLRSTNVSQVNGQRSIKIFSFDSIRSNLERRKKILFYLNSKETSSNRIFISFFSLNVFSLWRIKREGKTRERMFWIMRNWSEKETSPEIIKWNLNLKAE